MGRRPSSQLNGRTRKSTVTAEIDPSIVKRAAREAAQEILDEEDELPDVEIGGLSLNSGSPGEMVDINTEEHGEKDIFIDAPKKAALSNDTVCYIIEQNSNFEGKRNHPYSWEQLQEEFGGGHFKIAARSVSKGFVVMVQTRMVGGSKKNPKEEAPPAQAQGPDAFSMITLMSQMSEKAEAKVAIQAQSQATIFASMMTAMVQSSQESSRQLQLIMMENQKQAQAQADRQNALFQTLLTSLLTKKPDDGFSMAGVMKMLQEAEKTAENRTKTMFELVEKKAETLAETKFEAMSAGQGDGEKEKEDDSLIGRVLKSIPMIAAAATAGGNPHQMAPQAPQPSPVDIEMARVRQIQAQQARRANEQTRIERQKAAKIAAGAIPRVAPAAPAAPVAPQEVPLSANAQGPDMKAKIFDSVKFDIADALLTGKPASQTASLCLGKLEKDGITRQSVIETFTLKEFYALARANGVPEMADQWIAEFYEHIAPRTGETAIRTPAQQQTDSGSGEAQAPKAAQPVLPPVAHAQATESYTPVLPIPHGSGSGTAGPAAGASGPAFNS